MLAELPAAVERLLGAGRRHRRRRRARTASSSGCATSCRASPRLSVVDPWQVKGLEYDGCLVADPHGLVAEAMHPVAGLRSLYVALTRATQRLVVVSSEPLETLL